MVDVTGTEAVIQGVTAPMVAVPGPGQALMARSAGFGGTMPGMTAKIALRNFVLQLDAESWRGLSRRPRVATVPQPLW